MLAFSCKTDDDRFDYSKEYNFNNVKIIAHRGFWQTPGSAQNSLKSIQLAIDNNMHGAEIDVRMSSDSILYLNHDPSISGFNIRTTPSTQLDQIRLANGEYLTRFDEVVNLVKLNPNFIFYVEIKESGNSAYDKETVRLVNKKIEENSLTNQTTILSFNLAILRHTKTYNPLIKTLFILQNLDNLDYEAVRNAKVNNLGLRYDILLNNPDIANELVTKGYQLNVWTVNDLNKIIILKDLPIQSISTDIPDKVMEIY